MLRRSTFALLLLTVAALPLAGQGKLDEEQAKLLEEARQAALTYSDTLPDFLCTETIRRMIDPRGDNRWRHIDTLTVRLSYFEHKEDYKLTAVDGKATTVAFLDVGGALTTGEFGTRLMAIFMPSSKAVFEWKGWTHLRGRRAAVFRYRIAKENSTSQIMFGTSATDRRSIIVAYRGEVSIDETTHRVLRLTALAEIPVGFPIRETNSSIEYDFREVGGRDFLLPVSADSVLRRGNEKSENQVEFREYRKFHSESDDFLRHRRGETQAAGGKEMSVPAPLPEYLEFLKLFDSEIRALTLATREMVLRAAPGCALVKAAMENAIQPDAPVQGETVVRAIYARRRRPDIRI